MPTTPIQTLSGPRRKPRPTYRAMHADVDSDTQLCSDTVGAADEHRVSIANSFQVEEGSEAA
jgi:hypothetical protein